MTALSGWAMNLTLGVGVWGRLVLPSPHRTCGFCQKTKTPRLTFSQGMGHSLCLAGLGLCVCQECLITNIIPFEIPPCAICSPGQELPSLDFSPSSTPHAPQ